MYVEHASTCNIAPMDDCPENGFDFGHKTLFGEDDTCYHCEAVCNCEAIAAARGDGEQA